MATGCGMSELARELPGQFFDVGIEEEHAVTFSAGLAAGGMRPYCNIYSSFAQRAYDQIIHDVALQHLPVVFCFDRSGLVGEDGATHHGCFDLAAYRSIPGITIAIPKNEKELRDMMHQALVTEGGPWIIRYPRGNGEGTPWRDQPFSPIPAGKAERLTDGGQIAVLAAGPFACRAVEAAEILKQENGVSPIIYNIRYLKPLDEEALRAAASCRAVITIEDGSLKGGLYGAVAEYMAGLDRPVPVHGIGIPDRFIAQDTQAAQRAECGLDTAGILDVLRRVVKKD
jgi:1-deoxy-D-xylulose-5-phosphate synthase